MSRRDAPGRGTIRRLALARAISGTGSTAAYVALSYAVYRHTHSAAWVSASILVTFGVSGFAAPVSGLRGSNRVTHGVWRRPAGARPHPAAWPYEPIRPAPPGTP
jgi:hypothetical protein